MRLKRLEIYGFKSFADRTVVQFDQGITGIVGPNGSGKSNLSDAVRWVLGEQSAKSLRGGKMEDVIFGGTDKRRKMGYCEVSLVFDNTDHSLDIEYSEVMITRRVYRTGEGEYYINKSSCRLRDIIDLFRDTGIGRDGYSIIGQGRIDEILSQKSEDRRGIFEEAAGITKYRTRKEESEKHLANMRDNLSRVEDIIAELEKQLEPLAIASETARRFLALRDELRILDCSSFIIRNDRNEKRIEEIKEERAQLQEQIAAEEKEVAELAGNREQYTEQVGTLEEQVNSAHGDVLNLTRENEAREGELGVLRMELSQLEKDVLANTQERDVHKSRLESLGKEISENRINHDKTDTEIHRLEKSIQEKDQEIDQAVQDAQQAEDRLEDHKAKIIDSMNRQSDVRTAEARLGATRGNLQKRLEEAEMAREALAEDAKLLNTQMEAARSDRENANRECSEQEKRLQAADRAVQDCTNRLNQAKSGIEELNGQYRATESRLHVLKEMERDYSGYQQAVKQVLQYAQGNPGVHGVVATLMQVPQQYEKAIEAVLGGALQNIVTKDEYIARDMIAYLRQNNKGRATFLPITTIHGRTLNAQERTVLNMRGCIGVASELISFDSQYRGIMENLLGRTVIAENLDAGIEIMRKGGHAFRLVTLEGDVMHSGGSMTGGSSNSRMTSLLSRDREIKEHTEKLAEIANRITAAKERSVHIEEEREKNRREREALYQALNQLRIDVSIAEERIHVLEGKLEEQRKEETDSDTLLAQIKRSITEIDDQLEHIHTSQEGEAQSSEELNQLTGELSDALYEARKALEERREEGQTLRINVGALRRDFEALIRDGKRLAQDETRIAGELGEIEAAIESETLQHQRQTEEIAQRVKEQDACKEMLARANRELETKQAERTRIQNRINEITLKIDSIRESLAASNDRDHKAELVLNRLQSELDQLRNKIWDEYELTYAGAKEYQDPNFEIGKGERRAAEIRTEIRGMGNVNVSAVEEYRNTKERYDGLTTQRDDLLKGQEDLQKIIDELQQKMEKQFLESFRLLQEYLNETFKKLFDGGYAELRLQDEDDVLSCGIDIVAQPPGKKLQMLSLLSGGERALTAIAILFAMLRLKPTPFCFLDEIEAALDDGNISTFADYLKDFSKETQFVIVTHRKGTMERCDSLYGVAMEERGVSKMLSVELKDIKEEELG